MIIAVVSVSLLIIIVIVFIAVYNVMIYSKNRVFQSLSNIDVLLKQRNDEIGNLVNVVKGYSRYEIDVLEKITKIRSGFSERMSVADKDEFNRHITEGMKSLFAVVENYPDIKADKQYLRLQERITSIENQIADRREYYNWSVTNYNTRCEQFPYAIIARMFGFKLYDLFKYKG